MVTLGQQSELITQAQQRNARLRGNRRIISSTLKGSTRNFTASSTKRSKPKTGAGFKLSTVTLAVSAAMVLVGCASNSMKTISDYDLQPGDLVRQRVAQNGEEFVICNSTNCGQPTKKTLVTNETVSSAYQQQTIAAFTQNLSKVIAEKAIKAKQATVDVATEVAEATVVIAKEVADVAVEKAAEVVVAAQETAETVTEAVGEKAEEIKVAIEQKSENVSKYLLKTSNTTEEEAEPTMAAIIKNKVQFVSADPVYFKFDSYSVQQAEQQKILSNAEEIKNAGRLYVVGFTDSVGNKQYNSYLAKKRADAVVNYLVSIGVDKKNIYMDGFGKCCYSKPNKSNADRAKNRRVELFIKPESYAAYRKEGQRT